MEIRSILQDPGPENRVYDYVDMKYSLPDVQLQQSLACQSSKDLIINTVPNACYGQLKSTAWNTVKSAAAR